MIDLGPFRDYSAITVYHPSDKKANSFVNIGIAGFIGGLTGILLYYIHIA
jgi:hypothetical protein